MSEQLLWAIKNGECDDVKNLINNQGLNINENIMGGRNPLHFAADYGHSDIVQLLIEKGADVNQPDNHGITALLAAIYENHYEVVKLLLAKGAKKDGKAPSGDSYKDAAESQNIKDLL